MGWANYNKQVEVVRWIQNHCDVDLWDAVAFGLLDQVEARIAQDPAVVNARTDAFDIPLGTALHTAARLQRTEAARVLLDRGADPNVLAGDGRTPLDVAEEHGASEVAALVAARGGVHSDRAATEQRRKGND
jgi:hypothetical protein